MRKKNYIREYYDKISSGEIVACKRIKQQYKLLVDELDNPKMLGNNWEFDINRATDPIEFIETFCRQSKGTKIGKKVKLELFQKAKIQAIYGFIDKKTKMRRCRESATIEGRKNGKTTESSGLSLNALMADGEGGAEVYFLATKKDQAKKGFNEACHMITQSPELRSHLIKRKSDVYFPDTFSTMQALSSESDTLDSLNSSYITIDELHAIKNRDLYDVMQQSMYAREQPLLNITSTNGFHRDTIFDDQYEMYCNILDNANGFKYDGTVLAFIYELDNSDEWTDEKCWIKANPGLGTIKSFPELKRNVERAKVDDKYRRTVLVKDFNLKQSAENAWLSWEDLNNEETFNIEEMGFTYGIGGVDLSSTTDLTSVKMICRRPDDEKIYVLSQYFMPEATFEERCKLSENGRDSVPYRTWHERGLITLTEGNKVDYHYITEWFRNLQEKYGIYLYKCGYDPWASTYWINEMKLNYGDETMVPVIQGAKTFSNPMKDLAADLKSKVVVYNNNPIDKWCFSNTVEKKDDNNNVRPVKGTNQRKRVDGTFSLLDAYTVYYNCKDEYLVYIEG